MKIPDWILRFVGKKIEQKLNLEETSVAEGQKVVLGKRWFKSKTALSDITTVALGLYGILSPILVKYGVNMPDIPPELLVFLGGLGFYGRTTASGPLTK